MTSSNEMHKEKLGQHLGIGRDEFWSIDVIGGVVEIDSKQNVCYVKIKTDNGQSETIVHLKRSGDL